MTADQLETNSATPRVYSRSDLALAIQARIAALRAERALLQGQRERSALQRAKQTRGATLSGNFGRV